MSQIGDLGKKLEGALGNLSGSLSGDGKGGPGIIQKVDQLVTENRENIQKTTANLQSITDKVNKGEGTLGKLINDPKLHDDLLATLSDIKQGATDAKNFLANAQAIVDQVKAGKGTLGALVFESKSRRRPEGLDRELPFRLGQDLPWRRHARQIAERRLAAPRRAGHYEESRPRARWPRRQRPDHRGGRGGKRVVLIQA